MDIKALIDRSRRATTIDQILRVQLNWMMLLRIILYTSLLGLSLVFQETRFEVTLMPRNLLILHLLVIFTITIISALYLLNSSGNTRRFGIVQNLFDTLFASVLVYYTGASHSIFTSVYFFPIIAGGLILPRKGGLVAAAASTLLYGLILTSEILGYFPSYLIRDGIHAAGNPMVSLNHFAVSGLTFFLAAVLSALFGLRLQSTENALTDSIRQFDQLATLYKQIFDNITTGIITVDERAIITSANNATEAISGYPIATLIGMPLGHFFATIDISTRRVRRSADLIRADGRKIRIGYSIMFLQQEDNGKAAAQLNRPLIVTLQDISEVEQLERQMRQSEKLAAIGMMSASIAHDFRNPLTAISGSAQVLADEFSGVGGAREYTYELADIILRESNRMIDTIADFLKFSRPETAQQEWFSLRNCLAEVLQVCKADPNWPQTASVEITLVSAIDIWADQNMIFTVLSHLINNGMAFCPAGREVIEIEATEQRNPDGQDIVSIAVSDNGPGVAAEDKEKIFEPFYTTRADGTGLGLAIVKQIVDEHHGSLQVERGRRGGARFVIKLPLPC